MHKIYLTIHVFLFAYNPFLFLFHGCIWSKINMIFVILVLSLLGIDTKIVKIVRFNFHTSAAFRLFPAHMEGFGQKQS
jgi:hypothetical protein